MTICALCQRESGVAPLHAGASEQLCGRCVGRLAERLPRLGALFSPTVKPPLDALDPDAAAKAARHGTDPELLKEFQRGVRTVVGPEDVETHLDLAIAYREMGLPNDAMSEFALVLEHARGELLARALNALFGKGSGWKRDLRTLRDAIYPA